MKDYEQLVGAFGEDIIFQPERRKVREAFPSKTCLQLVLGTVLYTVLEIGPHDLVIAAPGFSGGEGDRLDATLVMHGIRLAPGQVTVLKVLSDRTPIRVALAWHGEFLDVADLVRRDADSRLLNDLRLDLVRNMIPLNFLRVIDRATALLHHTKRVLDQHEVWLNGESVTRKQQEAFDLIWPEWESIEHAASQAALSFMGDIATRHAAKRYVEAMLTQHLMGCPMHNRSFHKPLGYPGDFQTMLYSYRDTFEGATLFDRVFHRILMKQPLCVGVRTRKDFIVELMKREHDRVRDSRDFHAMSLGCGPAREVTDYINAGHSGSATWTLIDQERVTLQVAYTENRLALARNRMGGAIKCLNLSFGQLLADTSQLKGAPAQDFVYCVGLFDYLKEETAQPLVKALYDLLRPGGLVAVGNARGPNTHFWSLEFVLDWSLLYRSKEDMLKLAKLVPAEAQVEVTLEPSEAYYFLLVRKPA